MENKVYHLRYLPIFEQDLISTASYITNVLKNEDAALRLIDDEEVDLYMVNPKAPCFIKNEEESYIYLILPVSLVANYSR